MWKIDRKFKGATCMNDWKVAWMWQQQGATTQWPVKPAKSKLECYTQIWGRRRQF